MNFFQRRIRSFYIWFLNTFFKGTHFFAIKRFLLRRAKIKVGKNTKVVGPIRISNCAKLTIGDNCWIGKDLTIYGDGEVIIGNNCDLAPDVSFITGSHFIGDETRRAGQGKSFKIVVEDACWIGAKSSISGNTTVGKATVVGACSLVVKNVGTNLVVGGVPAKTIKEI